VKPTGGVSWEKPTARRPWAFFFPVTMVTEPYTELTELAGGFIHEIKNHLSTLGLNLQLLAEDFQEPQSQRERRALTRVQRLQGECQRLVEVANDFLRFARIKDLDFAPTSLGKVLDEMIDFFGPTAKAANIEIKTYVPADLPEVLLDRDLFKQVLLNLMLNAEQAMPRGGELTIQAACEESSPLAVAGPERDGDCCAWLPSRARVVCLSLIDTGVGMAPEVRDKIFQPFFSTKQAGSGLGLPTTRRIVEAHGGTIAVESEPDRGSKFTVRLPVPAERLLAGQGDALSHQA
jgi:signal transduction histidine kinase